MIDGVIVVDKPAGLTSQQVVGRIRRAFGMKKVGHTGTLDPFATGVLPVCLGRATKLADYLMATEKTYECVARFGVSTDTQDIEGETIAERDASELTSEAIESAMWTFRGEIDQVPPMFSAIKVDGKKLYELARKGKEIERKARRITIEEFELLSFAYGHGRFRVRCSKGTYIRTLLHDLGEALGVGAHLTELRRTASGGFTLADATPLEAIQENPEVVTVIEVDTVPLGMPSVELSAPDAERIQNGVLPRSLTAPADTFAVRGPSAELLALMERTASGRIRFLRGI